jgi:hypothetical protein
MYDENGAIRALIVAYENYDFVFEIMGESSFLPPRVENIKQVYHDALLAKSDFNLLWIDNHPELYEIWTHYWDFEIKSGRIVKKPEEIGVRIVARGIFDLPVPGTSYAFKLMTDTLIKGKLLLEEGRYLYILVGGKKGTRGNTWLGIPYKVVSSPENIKVYIDNVAVDPEIWEADGHYWIHVSFIHSEHLLFFDLSNVLVRPPAMPTGGGITLLLPVLLALITLTGLVVLKIRK